MGLYKIASHKWNGCKCKRCGKTRNEGHDWTNLNNCIKKCTRCGEQRETHDWDGCTCKKCGKVQDKGHRNRFSNLNLNLNLSLAKEVVIACCASCGKELWRKDYKKLRQDIEK